MTNRKRVLILCTGNSARSQMAEGLLRNLAGNEQSRLAVFRRVRDEILEQLGLFCKETSSA